jgi:hypothetical protein
VMSAASLADSEQCLVTTLRISSAGFLNKTEQLSHRCHRQVVPCAQLGKLDLGGILWWLHGHLGGLDRALARPARHSSSETAQHDHGTAHCARIADAWLSCGRSRWPAAACPSGAVGRDRPVVGLWSANVSTLTDEARSQASAADSHAWKAWISPSCWQIQVLPPSAFYRLVEARLSPAWLSLAPPSSLATAVGSVPSCCGAGCLRAAAAPAAASSWLTGSQWHSHRSRKASRLDVAE